MQEDPADPLKLNILVHIQLLAAFNKLIDLPISEGELRVTITNKPAELNTAEEIMGGLGGVEVLRMYKNGDNETGL